MSITRVLQTLNESFDRFIEPIASVELRNFEREVDEVKLNESKILLVAKINLVFEKLRDKYPELQDELFDLHNKIKLFIKKINMGIVDCNAKINYSYSQDPWCETNYITYLQEIIYGISGDRNRDHIFKDINRLLDGEFDISKN